MKHHPAAFINAIAEEGTKEEAVQYLQKIWNENCEMRAALREIHDAGVDGLGGPLCAAIAGRALNEQQTTGAYKAVNGEDLPKGAAGTTIINDGRPT